MGVAFVLVLSVGIVACAPAAETTPSADPSTSAAAPAATSPIPATSATPEILTVGPGEKPPLPFDGDCADVLTEAQAANALNQTSASIEDRDDSLHNGGGISCTLQIGDRTSILEIVPRAIVDQLSLADTQVEVVLGLCVSILCSWNWENDDWWIVGTTGYGAEISREDFAVWGQRLGPIIAENLSAQDSEPWRRDQTGWWPTASCEALAKAIGDRLGVAVTGEPEGYHDGASAAKYAIDLYSHQTACWLRSGNEEHGWYGSLWARSGAAWEATEERRLREISFSRDGARLFLSDVPAGYGGDDPYLLTDGINVANFSVTPSGTLSSDELAVAIADAWLDVAAPTR